MSEGASAFPRSGRAYVSLRGRNNFATAYRGRRRTVGAVVVLISEGSAGSPQVAIVAGKRVGNAVRRNRAKRRLRAAMARLRLRDGTAYVVIARSGVDEAPFERLVEWLTEAVDRSDEGRKAVEASRDASEQERS